MFAAAHSAPPVPTALANYIQPTFAHGLRIWWAFFWRTNLIAIALTFITDIFVHRMYQSMDLPAQIAGPILKYDMYVYIYIVAFFVIQRVLHMKFRHFRLDLLSHHGGEGAQSLEANIPRTARVWFTYSWRGILYRAVAAFVTAIPAGVFIGIFTRMPVLHALAQFLSVAAIDAATGLFIIYSNILDEDFGDSRVCLLPRETPTVAPVAGAAAAAPS